MKMTATECYIMRAENAAENARRGAQQSIESSLMDITRPDFASRKTSMKECDVQRAINRLTDALSALREARAYEEQLDILNAINNDKQ